MDILHITHQFAPETKGGVESYVADVVAEQRRQGLDVQILTGSHQPWDHVGFEELEIDGTPLHRLHRDDLFFDLHSKAWHPGVERAIGEFLDRHRPEVVHVHQWIRLTNNLVEIIRSRSIPVVVTLHDYYTSCPRAFRMRPGANACRRPLSVESCVECVPRYGHESREEIAEGIELFRDQYQAELAMAGAVVVCVESTVELIAATTGAPRERFRLLPLGYRRRFPGQARLSAPSAGETFRFAYWGGVARHKGTTVLVDGFRRLCESGPPRPVELHVLGHVATPEFDAELRNLGTGLPVNFHGPFSLEELLAVAPHVGVFPSTCLETFGLVLDECFELGLPAIVANHGALPVRAGDAALKVEPGNPIALADAMRRLIEEPATLEALRAAIPPLPADVGVHCQELQRIYQQAGHNPEADAAEPLPAWRRTAFLLRQRESALSQIEPTDGPH